MPTRITCISLVLLVAACGADKEADNQAIEGMQKSTLEVTTYQGAVRGTWADEAAGIRRFMGIPYAQAPVGELRWRPPQAPAAWNGVREADQPGAACWQPVNEEQFVWSRGQFQRSEDCLFLNVWSAQTFDAAPVMVWFHGGAHTAGMGHDRIFDGTNLARRDVVVVTVNYRLGAFGFLAHPALQDESDHGSAGNYGLLDKMAALNWIRDNISQFGGDPDNVTIFGQSAGSQSVCALMASPLAEGLFHKAIGQSAACVNPMPERDPAGLERGARLVDALGTGADLAAMRAAAPEDVLAATEASGWANASRIVTDGWVLPDAADRIYAAGGQARIPLLLGSLSHEGHLLFPLNDSLSEDDLNAYLDRVAGAQAAGIRAHYASPDLSPGQLQHAVATDLFMAYGMRRWATYQAATGQPTYLYFMDHAPPAFRLYVPDRPDLQLPQGPRSAGAYHSGDLAYVFDNTRTVGHAWQDDDHAFSDLIATYWTNFAKTGDPNGEGLPAWQPYDAGEKATMLLQENATQTVKGVRREVLDLWDQRFAEAT